MSGDAHVRICESLGVQFPRATRLFVIAFSTASAGAGWARCFLPMTPSCRGSRDQVPHGDPRGGSAIVKTSLKPPERVS